MSEQNKKEYQTPYEEYRVKAGYTRESASEELNGISPDKIYRIEKGKQTAAPDTRHRSTISRFIPCTRTM